MPPTPLPKKVLIPMHPLFDLMDVFGPIEILSIARHPISNTTTQNPTDTGPKAFEVFTTSSTSLAESYPGIKVAASISLREAYDRLGEFDILVVPGGNSVGVLKGRDKDEPMGLVRAFAALPAKDEGHRVIMSVCTGALFLARAGVLQGQTATTNINDLERLRSMVSGSDTVVADNTRRFVVNPVGAGGRKGVRVMTSRGPGAGLDLSLWVVQEYVGVGSRRAVEGLMEYQGRLDEGLVL